MCDSLCMALLCGKNPPKINEHRNVKCMPIIDSDFCKKNLFRRNT